jgi:D-amino peptidase
MTVLISADMEGISGVVLPDHTTCGHTEYERFRRLMTAEVNAAAEGALKGGATRVIVNDSHGKMTNLILEELNANAELISGSPKPFGMMQGIGPEVDCLFFIGYHAASGSQSAVLEHTSNDRVVGLSLNGQIVGELGMNAALAGHFKKPVVLVSGDKALTSEAVSLLGDIETVAVKEGITRTSALCLNPQVARAEIRQAAERALKRINRPGFTLVQPIRMRIVFHRASQADMAGLIPTNIRVDGRTVEWVGQDMISVYQTYRAMLALSATA